MKDFRVIKKEGKFYPQIKSFWFTYAYFNPQGVGLLWYRTEQEAIAYCKSVMKEMSDIESEKSNDGVVWRSDK